MELCDSLSLRAGSFRLAVEAIPDRDGEVDIDFDSHYMNLRQVNFYSKAALSDEDVADQIKYRWEGISVPALRNIARMIPGDTLYWTNRSLDLEIEIEEFETNVLNILKPRREFADDDALFKRKKKEYDQQLKQEWAERAEYRRLKERLDEARAHIQGMGVIPTKEGFEFYIYTDEFEGEAMWIIPAKRVIEINE